MPRDSVAFRRPVTTLLTEKVAIATYVGNTAAYREIEKIERVYVFALTQKAYTDAKAQGFRLAIEASEKSTCPIDEDVIGSWGWADAVAADGKLYDMLSLSTAGDALGVVESVPSRGFEAWRLLNVRFNGVGEMYSFDKMNKLMNQSQVKSASAMPAAIQKLEHDLKNFHGRTGEAFPRSENCLLSCRWCRRCGRG